MIDTHKTMNILDKLTGENVKVRIFTSPHAFERFMERGDTQTDQKMENDIEKAAKIIVNDYPHEDGEFIIRSVGVKIPFVTKMVSPNEMTISIPTILDQKMYGRHERALPVLTFESLKYMLYKEILI